MGTAEKSKAGALTGTQVQTHRQTGGRTDRHCTLSTVERQTDRQCQSQPDRQAGRQTDRQTDGQTVERQADRQCQSQTDRGRHLEERIRVAQALVVDQVGVSGKAIPPVGPDAALPCALKEEGNAGSSGMNGVHGKQVQIP